MSSSDIAVSVRGLSKSYTIAHNASKHTTAAEALVSKLRNPFQKSEKETFWALKDVEFDIKKGDVVGIIGRNGAGKSTLLKILSRITEPTTGRIALYGRVGSLLEVGTGFHPELTGRENIFLNGAILGMSKREIARQFDAIVDFAGVEQFLDTPVKRYSSGMYVRLAFAVAAHLSPEILIVDEVLAVGDTEFQKKCLGKMQDVAKSGRTVLFVSHNMAAVRHMCSNALLLHNGRITMHGSTELIISKYLSSAEQRGFEKVVGKSGLELQSVSILDTEKMIPRDKLIFNYNYIIKINGCARQPLTNGAIIVRVYDDLGTLVSSINTVEEGVPLFTYDGSFEANFYVPHLQLFPGRYTISVEFCEPRELYLKAENICRFEVEPAMIGDAMWAYQHSHGIVRISRSAEIYFEPQSVCSPMNGQPQAV